MLAHLTIRDFAIIERLELSWSPALNVLTGETGAGKSIIIDAVGALLGDRIAPEQVRSGAARALIEGVFELDLLDERWSELRALLDERGLLDDDRTLVLARDVAGSAGRSVARVNGHLAPLTLLTEIGTHLVDIHGQSQHLSLIRPREHLGLLDRFAGLLEQRSGVARIVGELRRSERELHELASEERQARREEALLRHELAEIDAAGPRADEEAHLQQVRSRLRNVERLRSAALVACQAVAGGDERPGAVELLQVAAMAVRDIVRLDPAVAGKLVGLEEAAVQAEEAARALSSYVHTIEADPEELGRVDERLLVLSDLKRKYGDTLADVLQYLESARAKLQRLENREAHLAALEQRVETLRREAGAMAAALSRERRRAAAALSSAVEKELAELQMVGSRFRVELRWEDDLGGVPIVDTDGQVGTVAIDATGIDRVEFLISANPGEDPRPLARIASGGELARVSLALKSILSRADRRATLVFDEVDVGVGARGGVVVGEKLSALSREHQVLCVTHLPQVAAFADLHIGVSKQAGDGQTTVIAQPVEAEARVDELAAMLAGTATSTAARESARELLKQSDEAKGRR